MPLSVQFVASVDESPAYMGGKENVWRKLNLDGELQPHCVVSMMTSSSFRCNDNDVIMCSW